MLRALAIALGLFAAPPAPATAQGVLERLLAPATPQASQAKPAARSHHRRVRKRAVTPTAARMRGAAARVMSPRRQSHARAAADTPPLPGQPGDASPIVPRPVPTIAVETPFRSRFYFRE